MIDSATSRLRHNSLVSIVSRCALALVLIGALPLGCSDHRISFAEFLEIRDRGQGASALHARRIRQRP